MTEQRTTRTAHLRRTGIGTIRGHVGALLASAVLLALAYPRPGWWLLAYVALVPAAILAVRSVSTRRLAWTAFIVFSAWWLWMIRWLIPVTVGGYIALSLLQAAWFMLALLTLRFLQRRYNFAAVVALPMAWCAVELVRVNFPAGGFGWFVLGHTQASYLTTQGAAHIAQTADLFGEHTVSIIVAMTNGLLVDLMTRPIMRPTAAGGARMTRTLRAGIVVWVVVMSGAIIYGQLRIMRHERSTSRGPKITVVQTNVAQDNKRFSTPEETQRDWAELLGWTRAAAAQQPDLIVWPETMVPKPINPEARDFEWEQGLDWGPNLYHSQIADRAVTLDVNLLVGAPSYMELELTETDDGQGVEIHGRRANSAILYTLRGEQAAARYDKIHRVPFGEYIPWVDAVPWLKAQFIHYLTPYSQDYSLVPGDQYTVFTMDVRGSAPGVDPPSAVRFAVPICYEDVTPRIVRRMIYSANGSKRADLLVNITNSAWYSGYDQRLQQLQIATLRCIEDRVPMARSVNTGISGFIDSVGRVNTVVEKEGKSQWVDGIVTDRPRLDHRATLYGLAGNVPMTLLAASVAILVLVGMLRRGKMMR